MVFRIDFCALLLLSKVVNFVEQVPFGRTQVTLENVVGSSCTEVDTAAVGSALETSSPTLERVACCHSSLGVEVPQDVVVRLDCQGSKMPTHVWLVASYWLREY